jgi:hypothetical protein
MPTPKFAAAYRTNKWRQLSRRVIREEPVCWLLLPGCTIKATTADHIHPVTQRPELFFSRSNCRGACRNCNSLRRDTPLSELAQLRAALKARPMSRQQALAALKHRRYRQRAPALVALFGGTAKPIAAQAN